MNSSLEEPNTKVDSTPTEDKEVKDQWIKEEFENLLPSIQERWPEVAKQTLEATRGSFDELVRVISLHSGKTKYGVKDQLEDLLSTASNTTKDIAESFEPLEKQLEDLLDELNKTLRPKIEKPIKQRPLLAIGIAAGIGVVLGVLLNGGKRS
tara:strand:- start:1366 stop:1821 length:456 start_codon:yes stop_codon:yes gene_type:complete